MAEPLRVRKQLRARDELAVAALELVEQRGFEGVTAADIAAAADQSRRSFFRYFGSKEDALFHDVPGHLEDLLATIARRLDDGEPPWPTVPDALADLIRSQYQSPGLARRRLNLWQREPALRARWAEMSAQWENAIAAVVADRLGGQRDLAFAHAVAIAAIGSFRVVVTTQPDSEGDDFLTRVNDVVEVLGTGLASAATNRRRGIA